MIALTSIIFYYIYIYFIFIVISFRITFIYVFIYVKLYSTVHRIAALDLRALAVVVVPERAPLPVAHPVVQLALQLVLEIEEEKEVVAKVSMPREDMTIRRRREIKKEKGRGIGIRTETVIKKERRGTMLFLIKLNKKDAPGIVLVITLILIFSCL